jgi:predicted dehydrogenase
MTPASSPALDAYKKVIDCCDLVILTTPPGFRPYHFEAAVNAGKNIFMEKPVAVDAPGVRKVLEMAKVADEKNLKVVVGLQRRYQNCYIEALKQVKEQGIIGDIVAGQVYWNGGGIWFRDKRPDQNELMYQINNWYFFTWLCGDHINEQHIHNIDVANWFIGGHPVSAQGMGGRQQRVDKKFGQIYDHHYVEFTYANGVRINSQCRHQSGVSTPCAKNSPAPRASSTSTTAAAATPTTTRATPSGNTAPVARTLAKARARPPSGSIPIPIRPSTTPSRPPSARTSRSTTPTTALRAP